MRKATKRQRLVVAGRLTRGTTYRLAASAFYETVTIGIFGPDYPAAEVYSRLDGMLTLATLRAPDKMPDASTRRAVRPILKIASSPTADLA